MAGVTSTGFEPKTVDDCKTELETAFKGAFGESIDLSPQSVFGQIIGITAEREADIWALSNDLYNAFTPDGATGPALDNVAAITGTVRDPAFPSTVQLYATGTNGTVLTAGREVSVVDTGTRFQTLADVTLATATAWAGATAYTAGAVRRNGSSPARCYLCTIAGTSAGSGGPTGTADAIVDGTVTWRYLGDGAAYAAINAASVDTGPKVAAAGELTVIETPVSGWSNVVNPLDASLGADTETDAALRVRREVELRGPGKSTIDAIRTALFAVDGVTAVTVFENCNDTTDADGIPGHAVESLVSGGADADIRAKLFASVAAGIQTYGNTSGTVTDSQSIAHTVKFSRASEINIYLAVSVVVDPGQWPTDGATQLKELLAEFGDAQRTGKDVVSSSLVAKCFSISGVLDATVLIGTAPSPSTTTTIPISPREHASFDTSRIAVSTTPGTP